MKDVIASGDIIISNSLSFLDYIFLETKYSPLFTTLAFNKSSGELGLTTLSFFSVISHAMGIKFP